MRRGARSSSSTGRRGTRLTETTIIMGDVISPRGLIPGGHVVVEDGKIAGVGDGEPDAAGKLLDFRGRLVAPGLVDIHVHGGGGQDVMDASPGGLDRLSLFLAAGGVTSFLATTYTAPHGEILAAARNVRDAIERGTGGAEVLGVHMEGPYINPAWCGAQDRRYIRRSQTEELEEVRREAGGSLRVVTLAPEVEGALDAIGWLSARGIVPAAGHTGATYGEATAGIGAGLRHASHLFNAMSSIHHREPGVAGAALWDGRVTVELIADGVHLHPATLGLAARLKGPGATALISDAVAPAGLPDGEYEFGEAKVTVRGGRCLMESGGLAGGAIRLCEAVGNMVGLAGISPEDAVEMASSTPARIAGASDRKGSLAPGMDADIAVLDGEFSVLLTMVGGRVVYER